MKRLILMLAVVCATLSFPSCGSSKYSIDARLQLPIMIGLRAEYKELWIYCSDRNLLDSDGNPIARPEGLALFDAEVLGVAKAAEEEVTLE